MNPDEEQAFYAEYDRGGDGEVRVGVKNAGEDESKDKSKRKDTGNPKGNKDLQDIKEILNEVKKPIE